VKDDKIKVNCDRCDRTLTGNFYSFFNNETLCKQCSDNEAEIKAQIRADGLDPLDFEQCV
jgi:hypothetical protein